jgi:hypothetical protein
VVVEEEEATLSLRTTTKEGKGSVCVMAASERLVWW